VTRTYDMTNRAKQAAETTERIVAAAEGLLATRPLDQVTLQAIADDAGVTVQTVLRHMGSRDGCFEAVARRVAARVVDQRGGVRPGDVEGAVAAVLKHYEADGRLILNLLAQEGGGDPFALRTTEEGRSYHRAWVERSFAPALARADREAIDALVAATDLYVWKLLRLDLGRSAAEVRSVVVRLVRAALEAA
jgi:AcrR family transcriptional regulator